MTRSGTRTVPVFLDTNVFLYAAGGEHVLREPCRRILRNVVDIDAITSSEVVQEIRDTLVHELGHHFGLSDDEMPY